ncbi:MAG: type 4a pilus biogenesis protein PilO [Pseudomonadota bacterium]
MTKQPQLASKLTPPVQLAIAVGAVLVVALAGWFLLLSPKKAHASELEDQVAAAQLRLTQAQIDSRRKPTPPVETGDLFRLAKAMPDDTDMSGILLELNRVASDTGIEFESISPGGAATVGAYQVVPVTLIFEGNFYSLSDFLFRLRNLVRMRNGELDAEGRLFNVDSVTFGESQNRFPSIRATLQVNAFVYGTGTPATQAPPPAPTTPAPATTTPATTTPATTAPATTTPAAPAAPTSAAPSALATP